MNRLWPDERGSAGRSAPIRSSPLARLPSVIDESKRLVEIGDDINDRTLLLALSSLSF